MKNTLFVLLAAFVVVTGCQKKEEPKKNPSSGTTTTTGGTSTTGGSTTGGSTTGGPGTPTVATLFNGAFTTTEGQMSTFGFSVAINSANAWFSSTPTATAGGNLIEIGSVHLNSVALVFDTLQEMYNSQSPVTFSSETWSVTGNSIIPSFVQTNTLPRPTVVSVASLPATIDKTTGVTINLGTLSNFKVGTIVITDGTGEVSGTIIQQLTPGANSITVTSTQLNGFQTGQMSGAIVVMLENSQVLNISGKNFRFSQVATTMANVTIQ